MSEPLDAAGVRAVSLAVGGSARWQDKEAIGYPVVMHQTLGLVTDIKHPFMGSQEMSYDGWLNYQRRIFRNTINWKIQLNVRNILNENRLVAVKANPVAIGDLTRRDIAAYRIAEGRTWQLQRATPSASRIRRRQPGPGGSAWTRGQQIWQAS